MKKEDVSPVHDFLIAVFADRLGASLAKQDIVRVGMIDESAALGIQFSPAGYRKAKAALKRRTLPEGVHAEFEDNRILFLVADDRLMLG